jgi:hypothetical protein
VSASETPPEVPAGVLVQSLTIDDRGRAAGYRIFADGRYERLQRGSDWSAEEPLSPAQLEGVERALAAVPLHDLAGRYEGPPSDGEPHVLWMQVAHGGGVRAVSVVGDRRVPELDRLTALITDAF